MNFLAASTLRKGGAPTSLIPNVEERLVWKNIYLKPPNEAMPRRNSISESFTKTD
jgi:hypothetical protein